MTTAPPMNRRIRRSLITMVTLGLGVHLLLPQLSGLRATGQAIAQATWWLAPILIALEALSLVAYGQMLVLLLRRAGEPAPVGFVLRTTLVGNAIGRALPGGTATAFALVLGSFRQRGMDPVTTGTAMWGTGMLSSVVLACLLPIGVVLGLFQGHLGSIGISAVIAAIGIVVAVGMVPLGLRDPPGFGRRVGALARSLARGPLRRVIDPDLLADGARRGAENLRELARDRATLRRAAGWRPPTGSLTWLWSWPLH